MASASLLLHRSVIFSLLDFLSSLSSSPPRKKDVNSTAW